MATVGPCKPVTINALVACSFHTTTASGVAASAVAGDEIGATSAARRAAAATGNQSRRTPPAVKVFIRASLARRTLRRAVRTYPKTVTAASPDLSEL